MQFLYKKISRIDSEEVTLHLLCVPVLLYDLEAVL